MALPVRTVQALPVLAQDTGIPCGRCHVNPHGGGLRAALGRAFAANGNRLPGGGPQRYSRHSAPHDRYPGGMMGGYGPGPGMMGPGMMGQ